jgi:hypothetical protein
MTLAFIPYNRTVLLNQTKLAIVAWDTSTPSDDNWPAMPQWIPGNGQWVPVPLNQVAAHRELGTLPQIGHVLLRVWLMTGSPTNAIDVPNIGASFRAPGTDFVSFDDWACQAHRKQERKAEERWVPVDEYNRFEYAVTRNNCAGCSYGIQIEWLGYAYNES